MMEAFQSDNAMTTNKNSRIISRAKLTSKNGYHIIWKTQLWAEPEAPFNSTSQKSRQIPDRRDKDYKDEQDTRDKRAISKREIVDADVIDPCQRIYLNACKLYHVTPSSHFFRSLRQVDIDVPNHSLGPMGTKSVAVALVKNITVQRLNLAGNKMGSDGVRYLMEMLEENNTITVINLSDNDIGTLGMKTLTDALKSNRFIRSLDISENNIKDEDSRYLAELIEENSVLQDLRASYNSLGDKAGMSIGYALGYNSTLLSLDLSWNHLRQDGAIALCCGLKDNTGLETLNIAWNGFGVEGCHEMGKILKINRSLCELDLTANRVTIDAFKQLLKGLTHNGHIRTLKIGTNPITTDGATAILRAIADDRCTSLCHLDLSNVSVDDNFVDMLHELQKTRPLTVTYGITLRMDDIRMGQDWAVVDTDDPVTILFEYMKLRNLRLIDLFHSFDKDNSDTLTREELRCGLESFDIPLSQRSLDILMSKLDRNKDGQVDFEELLAKHKEHVRRIAKVKKEAGSSIRHSKSFERLEQLREAVRVRIATSSASSS
ncbi:hypothetical protein ACJMK2_030848 [Sinanodonta woodiana]|uniref:EF-hand domain-containing protein n=1 Tax=Sinanodonta woodiana TaxID=1069815 RepID=A0ABD3WYE4_SINWO